MLWLTKEFINLSNQLYKYILEKDISSLKVQINKNPKLIKKIDKVIRNDKTRDKFFNKINHGFFKRSPFLFAC
jgi:hypothetical protein